ADDAPRRLGLSGHRPARLGAGAGGAAVQRAAGELVGWAPSSPLRAATGGSERPFSHQGEKGLVGCANCTATASRAGVRGPGGVAEGMRFPATHDRAIIRHALLRFSP